VDKSHIYPQCRWGAVSLQVFCKASQRAQKSSWPSFLVNWRVLLSVASSKDSSVLSSLVDLVPRESDPLRATVGKTQSRPSISFLNSACRTCPLESSFPVPLVGQVLLEHLANTVLSRKFLTLRQFTSDNGKLRWCVQETPVATVICTHNRRVAGPVRLIAFLVRLTTILNKFTYIWHSLQ
jgi:hypothetical protein